MAHIQEHLSMKYRQEMAQMIPDPQMQQMIMSSPMEQQPCLLYTSPSPRDGLLSRMPSSA